MTGIVYLSPSLKSIQSKQKGSNGTAERELAAPDSGPDPSELEKLATLPYTDWSSAKADVKKVGVLHFETGKAFQGLNLYNSRSLSEAHLVDMNGKIVHSWSVPRVKRNDWHTTRLMKNGDLFAIVKDHKLIKLAWNSTLKWEHYARFHHDLAVSSNGLIYVPTRRTEMWTTRGFRIPVVKEYITVLTESGKFVKEISLFEALSPLISQEQVEKIQKWAQNKDVQQKLKKKEEKGVLSWENEYPDVFHVNSIELIERDVPGVMQKGDFLLSVRQLNLVCIFRPGTGELVWSWGPGEIECQHHASLLENDNVLLFDNGCTRGYSRIIELNAKTKRIVWEYKTSAPKEFFSFRRGGVQRLPNGNTLITESDRGRVFEVTPQGMIVWDFLNPDVLSKKKTRAVIYRMSPNSGKLSKRISSAMTSIFMQIISWWIPFYLRAGRSGGF